MAIVGIVVLTLAVRAAAGVELGGDLLGHLALLAGFVMLLALAMRIPGPDTRGALRHLLVVAVMFTLYMTLARAPFAAIPWSADAALAKVDRILFFGTSPALWMEARLTPGWLELLAFAYGFFVPFINLSILVGVFGRPDRERDLFVTGLALLYAMSFLGYLFLPARGPVVEMAGEFQAPLLGGIFHQIVLTSVERSGGPHGAFPSLHVGVSLYVCFFDLAFNRLRGLIYLPLVALIVVATVALS
jgi:hypothetical protein